MHKYIYLFIYIISSILTSKDFDVYNIPIQENGRIKPLDTFARNQLLSIYSKRTIKQNALSSQIDKSTLLAVDWLLDISLHPEESDKYKVFNIKNPEVVGSLGLIWDNNHLYSRKEVLLGLQNQLDYISTIEGIDENELTEFDQQMLDVYRNMITFQELSYSFTCILNLIEIKDNNLAKTFGIEPGSFISYYDVMKNANELIKLTNQMSVKNIKDWSPSDTATSILLNQIHLINQDKYAQRIKLIPPNKNSDNDAWLAPWTVMDGRDLSKNQEKILNTLSKYLNAHLIGDIKTSKKHLAEYQKDLELFKNIVDINNIKRESWFNGADLFVKSIVFYIITFLVLCVSFVYKNIIIKNISYFSIMIGFLCHLYGIILRIIIMNRPPITTLYESIIFVSLIIVLCACILEYNRRDGVGILTGSVCGIILHFVGFGYASDGDTLGMLVAVLNSNFWLATHVTTITTGYGTSLFAGILGHIYLIQAIRLPNESKYLKNIYSNLYGITIFALFFTMFGTILGGIWADQSWGRFWGWDPKENGALLIVHWQIMMLHLRTTGMVKANGFALGMLLNNIIVILAWFGVNLLSIGLHSYGFAEGIAINILLFILIELLVGLLLYYFAKKANLK